MCYSVEKQSKSANNKIFTLDKIKTVFSYALHILIIASTVQVFKFILVFIPNIEVFLYVQI